MNEKNKDIIWRSLGDVLSVMFAELKPRVEIVGKVSIKVITEKDEVIAAAERDLIQSLMIKIADLQSRATKDKAAP